MEGRGARGDWKWATALLYSLSLLPRVQSPAQGIHWPLKDKLAFPSQGSAATSHVGLGKLLLTFCGPTMTGKDLWAMK